MSIAKGAISGLNAALRAVGGTITYRRIATGIYNSTTGSVSNENTDTVLKGIISNVSKSEVSDLVSAQDKRVRISAGSIDFIPSTSDVILVSGVEHKIIQVNTTEQDNIPISYLLFLR